MVEHARSAERAGARFAAVRSSRRRIVIAAGALCFLVGLAIGLATLSPMLVSPVPGSTTAPVVVAGPDTQPAVAGNGGGTSQSISSPVCGSSAVDGPVNGVAFTMEVPSLHYKATVREGVGEAQLNLGPGHYPETAWPGRPGTVGIAAHNVYWLSFNRLKPGAQVIIRTRSASFVYVITGSSVVGPRDDSVLAQTPQHRLTLTTCYPLWAGALATQRLVFRADQLSS